MTMLLAYSFWVTPSYSKKATLCRATEVFPLPATPCTKSSSFCVSRIIMSCCRWMVSTIERICGEVLWESASRSRLSTMFKSESKK